MGARKRTATVLFTDLVGSTDLLSRVETSVAEAFRSRHFSSIRGALAVHGGREVKTLGDGFMTEFESVGAAVACAVTMQSAIGRDNSGRDELLSMRVGISVGEVTEDRGDLFGMPVVEASRLCGVAEPGQILASDLVRLLLGSDTSARLEPIGPLELKGIPEPLAAVEVVWDQDQQFALRVALADDSVLLREGIARMLESEGIDIVLQTGDAVTLLDRLPAIDPDVVLLDVRMPPTHTTEGLDAAERIRADYPGMGVLVLSAELQLEAATRLLSSGSEGVGYLLKDRVADIDQLLGAIRTVAGGGSVLDETL